MDDYVKYIKIQKESEDAHADDIKNQSAEGHRNDPSNAILIQMVADLNIKGRALDVGCCTGYHTEQLKEMLGQADGIDINSRLLDIAWNFERHYCKVGDMHNLDFDNETFDLVFAHEVLEHSFDLLKVFSEACRVLKPNGWLVFSLPCHNQSKEQNNIKNFQENDPHFVKKTPNAIVNLAEQAGLNFFRGEVYPIGDYRYPQPFFKNVEIDYGFEPHFHCICSKA